MWNGGEWSLCWLLILSVEFLLKIVYTRWLYPILHHFNIPKAQRWVRLSVFTNTQTLSMEKSELIGQVQVIYLVVSCWLGTPSSPHQLYLLHPSPYFFIFLLNTLLIFLLHIIVCLLLAFISLFFILYFSCLPTPTLQFSSFSPYSHFPDSTSWFSSHSSSSLPSFIFSYISITNSIVHSYIVFSSKFVVLSVYLQWRISANNAAVKCKGNTPGGILPERLYFFIWCSQVPNIYGTIFIFHNFSTW